MGNSVFYTDSVFYTEIPENSGKFRILQDFSGFFSLATESIVSIWSVPVVIRDNQDACQSMSEGPGGTSPSSNAYAPPVNHPYRGLCTNTMTVQRF